MSFRERFTSFGCLGTDSVFCIHMMPFSFYITPSRFPRSYTYFARPHVFSPLKLLPMYDGLLRSILGGITNVAYSRRINFFSWVQDKWHKCQYFWREFFKANNHTYSHIHKNTFFGLTATIFGPMCLEFDRPRLFPGFPSTPHPHIRTVFQAHHKSDYGCHPSSLRLGGKQSSQVGDQRQIPRGLRPPARTLKGDSSGSAQKNTALCAAFP